MHSFRAPLKFTWIEEQDRLVAQTCQLQVQGDMLVAQRCEIDMQEKGQPRSNALKKVDKH